MLASHTPVYLIKSLVHIHNMSHSGSGWSLWDALDHALDLEAEWGAHASEKGISAAHGCYGYFLVMFFLASRLQKHLLFLIFLV